MTVCSVVISISLVTILLTYQPATGYNDDLPIQKWSPDYFSYRFFPEPRMNYKRRMPSYMQSFSPDMKVGRVRSSWMVGDMGTMYKRVSQDKKLRHSRIVCVQHFFQKFSFGLTETEIGKRNLSSTLNS